MQRRVSYFDMDWDRKQKIGAVRLAFDDRTYAELSALATEEMSLLCSILRSDKPVYYDDETEILTTLPDDRRER